MVIVERNIYLWNMRWCRELGTLEECRRDRDVEDVERSGCDLWVGRKREMEGWVVWGFLVCVKRSKIICKL